MASKFFTTRQLLDIGQDEAFWRNQNRDARIAAAAIETVKALRAMAPVLQEQVRLLRRIDRRLKERAPLKGGRRASTR